MASMSSAQVSDSLLFSCGSVFNLNLVTSNSANVLDSNSEDDEEDVSCIPQVDCSYIVVEDIHASFDCNTTCSLTNNMHTCGSFGLIHVNCRSLSCNFTELETLLYTSNTNFSVIAVSETWLTAANDDLFNLSNYSFFSSSRSSDRRGGGIGLYISTQFSATKCTDLITTNTSLECIFVTLNANYAQTFTKTLAGCIYRPPNSDLHLFTTALETLLNVIDTKYKHCTTLLAGDFNLDLLKLNSDTHVQEFTNQLASHSFFPVISKPTRVTNNSASLIDNVFCNSFTNSISSYIIYNDISDHFPIAVRLVSSKVRPRPTSDSALLSLPKLRRVYKQPAVTSFIDDLNNCD